MLYLMDFERIDKIMQEIEVDEDIDDLEDD